MQQIIRLEKEDGTIRIESWSGGYSGFVPDNYPGNEPKLRYNISNETINNLIENQTYKLTLIKEPQQNDIPPAVTFPKVELVKIEKIVKIMP